MHCSGVLDKDLARGTGGHNFSRAVSLDWEMKAGFSRQVLIFRSARTSEVKLKSKEPVSARLKPCPPEA
jgi:hypothetical protein